MRILVMTKKYSRFGAICFEKLCRSNVNLIGVVTLSRLYKRKSLRKSYLGYFKKLGLVFISKKIIETCYLKTRIALKKTKISDFFLKNAGPGMVEEVLIDFPVEHVETDNVNSETFLEKVESMNIDVLVTCDFSQILKKKILDVPKIGCINVHASFLPGYRGPDPIFWVLFHEERQTGVSIHWMTEKIDAGNILAQRVVPIQNSDDEKSLEIRLAHEAAEALALLLTKTSSVKEKTIEQMESKSSYFKSPTLARRKELARKIKSRQRHIV